MIAYSDVSFFVLFIFGRLIDTQMVKMNRPKINNTKKDTSLYAIIVNDHRIDVSFIMIYELCS